VKKTATTHKKWLPKHEKWVHFVHRDTMRRKVALPKARLPEAVPATPLPVDCTGNAAVVCPMDGNDTLGDCGPVMCNHVNQIRSFGQGRAGFTVIAENVPALEAQYEQVSGGDNGTDEQMLVGPGGIWTTGIAGNPVAVVADHLDVDVTNIPLTQYCIDQFYAVCMAWSVPDDFLQNFTTGVSYLTADTPDPNNGHYTPLTDVSAAGVYRLYTWGSWCWTGPKFIASVDPESFVTFSALQFEKSTGYDSHGRHVSTQAQKWVALGGNAAAVATIVAQFPAIVPTPIPTPPGPPAAVTLAEVEAWVASGLASGYPFLTRASAIAEANAALAKNWPKP